MSKGPKNLTWNIKKMKVIYLTFPIKFSINSLLFYSILTFLLILDPSKYLEKILNLINLINDVEQNTDIA